jgi:hypothetical protein
MEKVLPAEVWLPGPESHRQAQDQPVHWAESASREVYDRAMGLFRSRARKKREKAAAEVLKEQTVTAGAQADVTHRAVTAEPRPNPDQQGWGRTIGQQIGKAREDRARQE